MVAASAYEVVPTRQSARAELRVVDPRSISGWDNLVLAHPDATVFHSSGWCNVLCESYKYAPRFLCAFRADELEACLPILEVNSRITGRRGICLPFTDECGPLVSDDFSSEDLRREAQVIGKENDWKYLEVRESNAAGNSLGFFSHDLRLDQTREKLFGSFEGSIRRGIRKAESSGLRVTISRSEEAIANYYRLHQLTRKRHGVPPQPFAFFKNIGRHLLKAGRGFVVSADLSGKPVAAAVFFHFGGKGIYKFGASDEQFQQLRPNNLVMWEGIKELSQAGVNVLSFGRTSLDNEGLRRFKLGWGASERTVTYSKTDVRTGKLIAQRDKSSGSYNFLFRLFPLWMNRAAGYLVYRHLA